MVADLVLASEAERDIAEAYAWYEAQRIGLGEEFLNCIDAAMESIRRTPEMHPVVFEDYRRGLIRRFPYGIFYEYGGGAVTIYGVFHSSRDSTKWRERLP